MQTTNKGGPNRLELVGIRFGMLLVVEKMPSDNIANRFLCKCDCGNERVLVGSELKRGKNKSCGCNRTPRTTHEYRDHPLYDVWKGMKARCRNSNHSSYHNYGGKGVTVCKEWEKDFISFYNWAIENGWQEGLQIDKDIKGNGLLYSAQTCCFVTCGINCQNRSTNKISRGIATEIRKSNLKNSLLAKKYNIHISTIQRVKTNKTWQ